MNYLYRKNVPLDVEYFSIYAEKKMYEMVFERKNRENRIDLAVYFIYTRKLLRKMGRYGGKWQSDNEILLYR